MLKFKILALIWLLNHLFIIIIHKVMIKTNLDLACYGIKFDLTKIQALQGFSINLNWIRKLAILTYRNQTGKFLKLTESFRVPRQVHDIAMGIIGRVSNRLKKKWEPKLVEGSVTRHPDFDNIDMSRGEWLVLARTKYMLN